MVREINKNIAMYQLTADQHLSAQEIMARSGANNFCLFLFSAHPERAGVRFICNYGMSRPVAQGYTRSLWRQDPFLHCQRWPTDKPTPLLLERGQLETKNDPHSAYWHFINGVGYRDIIAAIHPFSADTFLVGGLMRQEGDGPCRRIVSDDTLDAMNTFTTAAANAIMANWLSPLICTTPEKDNGDRPPALTPREQQVVNALARGYSNKQIAAQLSLSEYTIENHFKRLFKKFGVNNRTALLSATGVIAL